jgi:hypothetical protein
MKLTKDTKTAVEVGDVLRFSAKESYTVVNIICTGNARNFTIQNNETKQTIYAYPASKCYGAEIIKRRNDPKAAYDRICEKASDAVRTIEERINRIKEADREINWGDVGTMNYLTEKLTELQKEIERYAESI